MSKKIFCLFCSVSLFILFSFTGCDDNSKSYDETIVCLGNSLTAGYGTSDDPPLFMDQSKAYPARLEKKSEQGRHQFWSQRKYDGGCIKPIER